MKTVYDFYQDPSHGWLKVPLKELMTLGLLSEISVYSYIRGKYAYLEEDCDMRKFIKARFIATWEDRVKYNQHVSRKRHSKIRSYNCYLSWDALRILGIK